MKYAIFPKYLLEGTFMGHRWTNMELDSSGTWAHRSPLLAHVLTVGPFHIENTQYFLLFVSSFFLWSFSTIFLRTFPVGVSYIFLSPCLLLTPTGRTRINTKVLKKFKKMEVKGKGEASRSLGHLQWWKRASPSSTFGDKQETKFLVILSQRTLHTTFSNHYSLQIAKRDWQAH